jgi:peptide/nickel transport system permease protein
LGGSANPDVVIFKMGKKQRLFLWIVLLGAAHLVIACAGFFGPYDPSVQDRDRPYAPPMRAHWVDVDGHFHLRPFVYALEINERSFDEYRMDTSHQIPLHFFVSGARYELLGVIPLRLHLFGAEGAPVFLLGSDGYGRDLFSRTIYGGQVSLLAGLLATGLALSFGLLIGTLAGYLGGWADEILMRLAELFLALPWIYLLFAVRAFLPLSVSPLQAFLLVVILIGTVGWARPARLIRGIVLSSKEREYVRAARGFGATNIYLMRHHILPQTWSVVLTQAAVLVPQYVLAEVTLSFLGLGVPEPTPTWGNLLTSLQQYSVLTSYWWMYLPGLAMVPFFVGYLLLSSALQERAEGSKI